MNVLAKASFNLWSEPWIDVETNEGRIDRLGIEQVLKKAQLLRAVYEASPLVVVGIHRLLVSILQFMLAPKRDDDLRSIWKDGRFLEGKIEAFGSEYARRFDLFSEDRPFLQSSDIPLSEGKDSKPVSYLSPELPSGTAVTHYHHGGDDDQAFCSVCAARGLITIPAFATSGGAGIKPSINGVPPIYVIPGGASVFESLAASLTSPKWQPAVASAKDAPWWTRTTVVERSAEVQSVGYLQSLTFPARRVRLFPERAETVCTRCGEDAQWVVRRMVFEMGESRPKTADPWLDPFAAYRINPQKGPIPVRPIQGKAVWREFSSLFLNPTHQRTTDAKDKQIVTRRPSVLDQLAALEMEDQPMIYPFRCVGLRTDMKAKVFEWMDAGFEVPLAALRDDGTAIEIREALDFATECRDVLTGTFHQYFGGKSKKSEKHRSLKNRMDQTYWTLLASKFREYVLKTGGTPSHAAASRDWADLVLNEATHVFGDVIDGLGDDATTLAARAQAEKWCRIRLGLKRKEYLHE